MTEQQIETPEAGTPEVFNEPEAAVDRLVSLYAQATGFLCRGFEDLDFE